MLFKNIFYIKNTFKISFLTFAWEGIGFILYLNSNYLSSFLQYAFIFTSLCINFSFSIHQSFFIQHSLFINPPLSIPLSPSVPYPSLFLNLSLFTYLSPSLKSSLFSFSHSLPHFPFSLLLSAPLFLTRELLDSHSQSLTPSRCKWVITVEDQKAQCEKVSCITGPKPEA